jgi:hypothetical protein
MPGYTYSQPQTFVNNNWIVPLQSYTIWINKVLAPVVIKFK